MTAGETMHPLAATIESRFGGKLTHGKHDPDGSACLLEAVSQARGIEWTDRPSATRMPDLRPLNDARWASDEERTAHLLPVGIALWDWAEWPVERKVAYGKRVAERTIREILPPVLRLVGLDAEAKRCEDEGTAAAAAYDAAAAAAYAYDAAAAAASHAAAAAAAAAYDAAAAAAYAASHAYDAAAAAAYAATAAYDATAYAANDAAPPSEPLILICRIFVEEAAEPVPA